MIPDEAKPCPMAPNMVLAVLAGRKTETRRIINPQPLLGLTRSQIEQEYAGPSWGHNEGQLLYVTEHWRADAMFDKLTPNEICAKATDAGYATGPACSVKYLADEHSTQWGDRPVQEWGRFRHGRFMPRRLARIVLRVEEVWVEQVQEISFDSCLAEGLEVENFSGFGDEPHLPRIPEPDVYRGSKDLDWEEDPNAAFEALWDSINAERGFGWEADPWVRAYKFEVLTTDGVMP